MVEGGLGQGGRLMHATDRHPWDSDGAERVGEGGLACTHCGEEGQCKSSRWD